MRILLVEDNQTLATATVRSLTAAGFVADAFDTVEDAWHAWTSVAYDIVILDIMLNDESGLDLLARARRNALKTPVLLLTALGAVDERVRGLDRGADDYLVKPFAIEELLARLRALARRPEVLLGAVLTLGDAAYDIARQTLSVGDHAQTLSRAESLLIERFFRAPDTVLSKTQLGEALHPLEADFSENSLHILVHRIRRKLLKLGTGVTIHTVRGLGYVASAQGGAKP